MRLPIFGIRALVIVALLFIAGPAAAQGATRERLIGTWWYPADQSAGASESDGVIIVRVRDDGIVTFSFAAGSYRFQMVYARWELEGDKFTLTPVRSLGEVEPSVPPSTVMVAFEDEALVLTDPASGFAVLTMQPGIPPQAIPDGNALSGTVTYSGGPYDEIVVVAYRLETHEMLPVAYGSAILLEQGEWQILGLGNGYWSVQAIVLKHSGDGTDVVGGSILSGGVSGSILGALNDGSYGEESDVVAKTTDADLSDRFLLEGRQQVVTGIALAPIPSRTVVETTTWGEVKARSR